jgi:hypothetical protein
MGPKAKSPFLLRLRGLIFGYTAELAGVAAEKRLDKMCGTAGFCGRFSWVEGNFNIGIYCLLGDSTLTSETSSHVSGIGNMLYGQTEK